jgi:3'-phosphoadenosine 5'-phosphosulfate sulfotransferase (PAPS reductase)/FAD synthetase
MDLLGVERRYLTSEKRQESTESNRQDAVQIRSTTNIRNYRDTSATVWNSGTSNLEIGGAVTEISPAELYQMIRTGDIPEPIRLQMMEGNFKNPNATKSIYNKEKWQFMLFAPFEISNKCCSVMKKAPAHKYGKDTGRYPMTAEMASESKLRAQKWMDNGCNGFDMKSPKSMPMAFWLEQDVLAYIKLNNIEIPSVYGDIVAEYQGEDNMDGQMSIADYSEFGVFDLERPLLTTTGCARTGCIACGFGIHLEKPPCNRLYAIEELSNPKVLDWFLRGGDFDPEDGLWKPDNRGLGFWFVYEWVNQNGNLRKPLEFPHRQEYIEKYHTELTDKYLYEGLKYRT